MLYIMSINFPAKLVKKIIMDNTLPPNFTKFYQNSPLCPQFIGFCPFKI